MKQLLVFLCMLLLAAGIEIAPVEMKDLSKDEVTVLVDGAVNHPGEVQTQRYATVQEVLDKAGLKEDADVTVLNPSAIVNDRDVIHVPYQKEEGDLQRISINTADEQALCTLPGIGEGTAAKIVQYREEHGFFQDLDDLKNVAGIGDAKFEKLKDLISL